MTTTRPSRRTRWLISGAATLTLALLAGIVLDRGRPTTRGAGGPTDGHDMAGMPAAPASSGSSARLTADQIREFGVTFGTAEERALQDEVRAVGIVAVDETRLEQVAPRFGGYVERLYVEATGAPVRRGQPLMEVYSPELFAAQLELLAARRLQRAPGAAEVPGMPTSTVDLVTAARHRLTLAGMSGAQVEQVLRDGEPLRAVTILAPAAGVVLEKGVVQGQAFQPGQALYTIADLGRVWVEVELRGADAALVHAGSMAEITLDALASTPIAGRVEYVYPTVDAAARTVRARVVVANGTGVLRPGMFATVRLTTPARRALTVPATAVVRTGERAVVFVDMGGGTLMPHEVELGRATSDQVEVLAGVERGQRVVTSAQYLVDAESNLADVMRAMMGQMGQMGSGHAGAPAMDDMPGITTDGMPADRGADVKDAMPGMSHGASPRR
jgi:Cu(I)/Ag(I) efflux system membrane fusion protein